MLKYLSLLFFYSFCCVAVAQNAPRKMKYSAAAGAAFYSGNVDKFDAKVAAGIQRVDSTVAFDVNGKFVYGKSNGNENNCGVEAVGKLDFFQYSRWSPFVALECRANEYKGYYSIFSALAGGKYRIYKKERVSDYSVSLAGVYDRADYTPEKTDLSKNIFRLSLRPKAVQKFGDVLTLKDFLFYQPALKDFCDYVVSNTLVAECRISSVFYLCVEYGYEYRSKTPSEKFKNIDSSVDVSLKFVY